MASKYEIILGILIIAIGTFSHPIPSQNNLLALDSDLFEGDMILTDSQIQNGMVDEKYRWPGGIVVYELDPAFTKKERSTISKGMKEITSKTCIRFRQKVNDTDYVSITRGTNGTGCNAQVGKIGGKQKLNLAAPGCIYAAGPIPHELMHSIGFQHEHSRPDRDKYVEIFWENLKESEYKNFYKIKTGTTDFGFPYDYVSIMQYPADAFSFNGNDTIGPIPDRSVKFGTYDYISSDDAKKVNIMYKGYCPDT